MTNIFKTPRKVTTRDLLIAAGERVLKRQGWAVERVGGTGKSSVRRIRRGSEDRIISIKSTQDQWLAFSRTPDDKAWSTLAEVDAVLVASVDRRERPTKALVHLVDADELRERFDRAYAARLKANRSIPVGRGVWISLYDREDGSVTLVGAGVGLTHPATEEPLAFVPDDGDEDAQDEPEDVVGDLEAGPERQQDAPLTIPEAKRRLAMTFGVDPSAIKISVEG